MKIPNEALDSTKAIKLIQTEYGHFQNEKLKELAEKRKLSHDKDDIFASFSDKNAAALQSSANAI